MGFALVGFGEAGKAFAKGLHEDGHRSLHAFDIKDMASEFDVRLADRSETLVQATMVFCLVTADRALDAARQCAPYLNAECYWYDANSCAPGTKREAAKVIEGAGAHYIDAAIMAPVYPKLHRTAILLSGIRAEDGAKKLTEIGMNVRVVGEKVGDASSIKMIRSVMVKGMEALFAECFLAARKAGVEQEVLGSLTASNPDIDWQKQASYNMERMCVHGVRRASEMREVVATLKELGFHGDLSMAVSNWQQRLGELELEPVEHRLWDSMDLVLSRL